MSLFVNVPTQPIPPGLVNAVNNAPNATARQAALDALNTFLQRVGFTPVDVPPEREGDTLAFANEQYQVKHGHGRPVVVPVTALWAANNP